MGKFGETQKAMLDVGASVDLPMLWHDVLLPCPLADHQTQLLGGPWQAGEAPQTLSCRRWVGQDITSRKAEKLASLRSGNMLVTLKKKDGAPPNRGDAVACPLTNTLSWPQSLVKSVERLPVT